MDISTKSVGPRLISWVEVVGQILELAVSAVLSLFVVAFRPVTPFLSRLNFIGQYLPKPAAVEAEQDDEAAAPKGPEGPEAGGKEDRGRFNFRVAGYFTLAVLTACLSVVMQRVDSALGQMKVGTGSGGGALGFPTSLSDPLGTLGSTGAKLGVETIRQSWTKYGIGVSTPTALRNPFGIAHDLVRLDIVFIVAYTALLALTLIALYRANAAVPVLGAMHQPLRANMLRAAAMFLVPLALVDAVEDWQLWMAFGPNCNGMTFAGSVAIGPMATMIKMALTLVVLVPPIFVAVTLAVRDVALGRAIRSVRGVIYGVGALVLLLMVGIGAAQIDDVIRAWDVPRALFAVAACAMLAVTVAGLIRRLSCAGVCELPAPESGNSAQAFTLGAGVLIAVLGLAMWALSLGWGLIVAGGLLILLWLLGLPYSGLPNWSTVISGPPVSLPPWITATCFGAGGLSGLVVSLSTGSAWLVGLILGGLLGVLILAILARQRLGSDYLRRPGSAEPPAAARRGGLDVATAGDRLGRALGSLVAAVLVVVIARATALDALIRDHEVSGYVGVLVAPAVGAVLVLLVGLAVCAFSAKVPEESVPPLRTRLWFWATVVSLVVGAWLFPKSHVVASSERVGSAALIFGGFTLALGLFGILASGVRLSAVNQYALSPALRVLRLQRFPVVPFLVVWVITMSVLDVGGYHDIRRDTGRNGPPAPTIAQAWQQFLLSAPTAGPRPVVLVAAEGGGIRAAVWTSIVMECIFGPGPVKGADGACHDPSKEPERAALTESVKAPLPIFLASGASGGSVGLAAWTARRTDVIQDGVTSKTPLTIEETLKPDFVAPNLARLILADVPQAFLAWHRADRAAVFERAWEAPWPAAGASSVSPEARGLSRGLRQTWDVTHTGASWGSPVLALNGISVEDGCRVVASAVDFTLPTPLLTDYAEAAKHATSADDRPTDSACRGPRSVADLPAQPTTPLKAADSQADLTTQPKAVDVLPATNELIDYLCTNEDVPLSTAAHISARFPYFSPSGRIARQGCPDELGLVGENAVSYDADGGIFDNSGAGTAVDAWNALAPIAAASEGSGCLVPIMIQIDNSPPAATDVTTADTRPMELVAPITSMLGQIGSRENYSRSGAAATHSPLISVGGKTVGIIDQGGAPKTRSLWFRVSLVGQPGPEPPLGWTLAQQTIDDMRHQLSTVENQQHIAQIRALLKQGNLTCS